jgi:hypothetical protein
VAAHSSSKATETRAMRYHRFAILYQFCLSRSFLVIRRSDQDRLTAGCRKTGKS